MLDACVVMLLVVVFWGERKREFWSLSLCVSLSHSLCLCVCVSVYLCPCPCLSVFCTGRCFKVWEFQKTYSWRSLTGPLSLTLAPTYIHTYTHFHTTGPYFPVLFFLFSILFFFTLFSILEKYIKKKKRDKSKYKWEKEISWKSPRCNTRFFFGPQLLLSATTTTVLDVTGTGLLGSAWEVVPFSFSWAQGRV